MGFNRQQINKNIPVPLYYQLKSIILEEINKGNLHTGDMIPTEKEISSIFDISRTTIRQAITELVQDGYLYRMKGKGTFVSKPKINQDFMRKVETFNQQIERTGMIPSTRVIELLKEKTSKEVSEILKIGSDDDVVKLLRVRCADEEPIVLVRTYLPYELCSFIINENMDMGKNSLYEVLSTKEKTSVIRVTRTIEAVVAGQFESDLLQIKKGYPIQLTKTIGYNKQNYPIEYSIASYRGDRNKFTVEIRI